MPGVMLLRCLLITFRTEVVFTNLGIYGDEVCGRGVSSNRNVQSVFICHSPYVRRYTVILVLHIFTFRTEVVFTNLGICGDEVCGRGGSCCCGWLHVARYC
jgi:hypothetical protein